MTPGTGIFQTRRRTAVMSGAVLSIALMMQAAPAHAEPITLICQNEMAGSTWSGTFTLRVDYERKVVDFLRSNGSVALSSAARVTESEVSWMFDNSQRDDSGKAQGFMGSINRLSGQGSASFVEGVRYNMAGPCRRAMQKF